MVQRTQLPNVSARRLARQMILTALNGMELVDRRVVVEEVLADLLEEEARGATAAPGTAQVPRPTVVPPRPAAVPEAPRSSPEPSTSLPDRIVEFCRNHQTADGTYDMGEIARLMFPKGGSPSPVYTAIKRSSPQSDRRYKPSHPRFIVLGPGKFRLAEPTEKEASS